MKKYVVFDEICEIETRGFFEDFTTQHLLEAYYALPENDADIVCAFDSEEDALDYLDRMSLYSAKKLDWYHGLVHIAFVRPVDFDDHEPKNLRLARFGDVIKTRVGA